MYYTVEDKNITEMQTVGYAVSGAGIRAPLYWFHAAGYFEEFLGHKKGEKFLIYLLLKLFYKICGNIQREFESTINRF